MNKSKLIKLFLVIALCFSLTLFVTPTFAVDFIEVNEENDQNVIDNSENTTLDDSNDSDDNDSDGNDNNSGNTEISNDTNSTGSNSLLDGNTNGAGSSKYNNTTLNAPNTNTNLPKTGIAETGSLVCVVFALALSAGYAFKKIKEYNV